MTPANQGLFTSVISTGAQKVVTNLESPNANNLTKLTGSISNLKVTRASASFVFTQEDQTGLGVVAVAAAIAGLGGQAMAAASNASAVEEEADYLEFEVNGEPVKGWVWRNPFQNGDVVSIAAARSEAHWESYGMARLNDRTIALYPHCSRGRARHFVNAFKWWFFGAGGFVSFVGIPLFYFTAGERFFEIKEIPIALLGLMAFFGVMTFSLSMKWMPFVRVAEKIFRTLDLPNPSNIDLVKSTKTKRAEHDPGELGAFYFRY